MRSTGSCEYESRVRKRSARRMRDISLVHHVNGQFIYARSRTTTPRLRDGSDGGDLNPECTERRDIFAFRSRRGGRGGK